MKIMKINKDVKNILIFILAIFVALISVVFSLYFKFVSVKEIGENFVSVFMTDIWAKALALSVSFITVFLISFISFSILRKNLIKLDSVYDFLNKRYLVVIFSVIMSILAGSVIQNNMYDRLLMFLNPSQFGKVDPVFFNDIGYYMFQRPFIASFVNSLLGALTFIFVVVFVLYIFLYLRMGITNVRDIFNIQSICTHNIINLSLLILVKAFSYKISAENMLFSNNKLFTGANFIDVNIWRIYYKIIPFILIAAVAVAIFMLIKRKIKISLIAILIYPVVYLGFFGVATVADTLYVKPREVNLEAPYIEKNIEYTKDAYNLNKVNKEVFEISYDLTNENIEKHKDTLLNTRIIDYPATLKATNQIQSIRNYYKFNDIDIVKYNINGRPTAVALSPREFNKENLDTATRSFINEKLRFTHGYGVVAINANKVTKEGQPDFIIKDIPPVSNSNELNVSEPRIYYGETEDDYVVVNSKYKELDYAMGDSTVEYSYTGKSGIKMNLFNRLMYSLYYKDFQLLISGLIGSDSKLLINRNVITRVETVAPFLKVDNDPYIVVDDEGRVKWILNCYTKSSYYPYSYNINFMGERINYIRESVKAVVDAYDGTVKFYITDENDPVVKSYKKIYPLMFEEGDIPQGIKSHMQYPELMFKVQSEVYKKYHVDNSDVFYNKTDNWDYAKEKYHSEDKYVEPYYTMLPLFSKEDDLVLMIPYTMQNKQNLVGWMAVGCSDENYGKMILYTFPKGESIYGTMQMENRIDNDPEISRQMTLWGSGGSSVIRGNMLVLPIGNSLIYVEPVYITSGEQTALPELKRVIVGYKDKIVMPETFEDAIYEIFGYKLTENAKPSQDITSESTTTVEPPEEIVGIFDEIKKSMAEGNWKTFGENFNKLESEINKMRQ